MDISLRKALESDINFLIDLRDITMRTHLEKVGMPVTRDEYIKRISYEFDAAQIVELDGLPVGLFKVVYYQDISQWYIIQIQIHPGYQNLNIGSNLIRSITDKALNMDASVGLSVIKTNPALKLYLRLGFEQVSESEHEFNLVFNLKG